MSARRQPTGDVRPVADPPVPLGVDDHGVVAEVGERPGETVVDPQVVKQLLQRNSSPLERLSPREREVLALMAEGRSNTAIARTLVLSEVAVAKNITGIFAKLGLPPTDDNRRILAVLTYLRDGARG